MNHSLYDVYDNNRGICIHISICISTYKESVGIYSVVLSSVRQMRKFIAKKTLRTHLRMCSFVLTFHIAPKFKNKLYEGKIKIMRTIKSSKKEEKKRKKKKVEETQTKKKSVYELNVVHYL